MNNPCLGWLPVGLAFVLAGCAAPQLHEGELRESDPKAAALIAASCRAHGGAAFARIRDISVRYDGKWAAVASRIQPVLADTGFRVSSEERLLVGPGVIGQEYRGAQGQKIVLRSRDAVAVSKNGRPVSDEEAQRAAALAADAYKMFLQGPFYLNRPAVVLALAGEAKVDGVICDRVLAVLRPGFGFSEQDRVLLFLDRSTRELRRVRMSLNGLESTQGAEVEVTFRDHVRIGGVLWPTDFDERIRAPFNLPAHRWRLLGLDLNRGLTAADLTPNGFKGLAARPAAALKSNPP